VYVCQAYSSQTVAVDERISSRMLPGSCPFAAGWLQLGSPVALCRWLKPSVMSSHRADSFVLSAASSDVRKDLGCALRAIAGLVETISNPDLTPF